MLHQGEHHRGMAFHRDKDLERHENEKNVLNADECDYPGPGARPRERV